MKGGSVKVSNLMMTAAEVAEVMDCCESLGYKMIRELNAELKDKGYITRNARIPRKYFFERTGLVPKEESHAKVL